MLQNGFSFVLFDSFRHHIVDIFDNSSSQLKVVLTFHALFGDCFCNTFRMSALELPCKQIAKPSLEQRNNSSNEEEPDTPSWCPKSNTRSLSNLASIEPVVDQVFEVFSHPNLPHKSILVPIHSGQHSYMGKDILKPISQLKCFNITQPVLHM